VRRTRIKAAFLPSCRRGVLAVEEPRKAVLAPARQLPACGEAAGRRLCPDVERQIVCRLPVEREVEVLARASRESAKPRRYEMLLRRYNEYTRNKQKRW